MKNETMEESVMGAKIIEFILPKKKKKQALPVNVSHVSYGIFTTVDLTGEIVHHIEEKGKHANLEILFAESAENIAADVRCSVSGCCYIFSFGKFLIREDPNERFHTEKGKKELIREFLRQLLQNKEYCAVIKNGIESLLLLHENQNDRT